MQVTAQLLVSDGMRIKGNFNKRKRWETNRHGANLTGQTVNTACLSQETIPRWTTEGEPLAPIIEPVPIIPLLTKTNQGKQVGHQNPNQKDIQVHHSTVETLENSCQESNESHGKKVTQRHRQKSSHHFNAKIQAVKTKQQARPPKAITLNNRVKMKLGGLQKVDQNSQTWAQPEVEYGR